ncbi:hypothetical protein PINS_up006954 [Pythium insidiosum]|nr:hypothetical protein PINS_up006954 [Pythium insidiosum]
MLKKKRKATRSAPAQTFPFCFRLFVYVRVKRGSVGSNDRTNPTENAPTKPTTATSSPPAEISDDDVLYRCVAATASSFFELYSTRTVDRVKRKYWTSSTPAMVSALAMPSFGDEDEDDVSDDRRHDAPMQMALLGDSGNTVTQAPAGVTRPPLATYSSLA